MSGGVLFVCTGNLCRSPIAEGLLRLHLAQTGRPDVTIDSAGIHPRVGEPPEPFAIEVAASLGADISAQRARAVEPADFERFDHLVAMDLGHLDFLKAIQPAGNQASVHLLLDDVGEFRNVEVPDPYRQDREAFEFAARLIDIGVKHLAGRLPAR